MPLHPSIGQLCGSAAAARKFGRAPGHRLLPGLFAQSGCLGGTLLNHIVMNSHPVSVGVVPCTGASLLDLPQFTVTDAHVYIYIFIYIYINMVYGPFFMGNHGSFCWFFLYHGRLLWGHDVEAEVNDRCLAFDTGELLGRAIHFHNLHTRSSE